MIVDVNETNIKGCYELQPKAFQDERGLFVKTFHEEVFKEKGLAFQFVEEYYSYSKKGVLRGLHFQTPPKHHVKVVYCLSGEVLDVVVDLRKGSPTFGESEIFKLNFKKKNMIYIPSGLAHGFYVTGDHALLLYKVTSVYSPENDNGIHWNSFKDLWPGKKPIVSERDSSFASFCQFQSPFIYEE